MYSDGSLYQFLHEIGEVESSFLCLQPCFSQALLLYYYSNSNICSRVHSRLRGLEVNSVLLCSTALSKDFELKPSKPFYLLTYLLTYPNPNSIFGSFHTSWFENYSKKSPNQNKSYQKTCQPTPGKFFKEFDKSFSQWSQCSTDHKNWIVIYFWLLRSM